MPDVHFSAMDGRLELWLVRHGETTYGAERRIAGWSNPPLTARGEREAAALRPFLDGNRFDSVWCSDLQRAVTTATLAWGDAVPDRRIRELNCGVLEGRSFDDVDDELNREFLRFRDFAMPGGESREQLEARVHDFLGALAAGRHLVFTHGGVIRLITQDLGEDRFLPTASIAGVDWRARRLLFVRIQDGAREVTPAADPE